MLSPQSEVPYPYSLARQAGRQAGSFNKGLNSQSCETISIRDRHGVYNTVNPNPAPLYR